MKKLTILLFSILISFSSYGEWTRIAENVDDAVFYIDKDTIKERDDYVYYWILVNDLTKTNSDGDKSEKSFVQADCDLVRTKRLSVTGYALSMGLGKSKVYNPSDWTYLSPGSVGAFIINYACNYVK